MDAQLQGLRLVDGEQAGCHPDVCFGCGRGYEGTGEPADRNERATHGNYHAATLGRRKRYVTRSFSITEVGEPSGEEPLEKPTERNESPMRQRGRKRFALLGLATVLALLLTACAGGGDDEQTASDGIITINWSTEPPSLDPGLATDTTSSNVLINIMDPLLKLEGEDLDAHAGTRGELGPWTGTPSRSSSASDGKWTNGDPVTAQDFEYSWKRTISPELAADYAYQFFGNRGR